MDDKIAQVLKNHFNEHRIVFWYDKDTGMRDDFAGVELPDVTKLEIDNNEFSLKYRILRQEPKQKFLLYCAGPAPKDLDNWLLDVELAHITFCADQVTIWLNELGLGSEYGDFIREHIAFFKAARRREAFKQKIKSNDKPGKLRLIMLAICCAADTRIDVILENLLSDLAFSREDKIRLIERCGLNNFLWTEITRYFGYHSETVGLKDFVIELFQSCYTESVKDSKPDQSERIVFLKRWKDSIHHREAFRILANECAEALKIEDDLQQRDLKTLAEIDYFQQIDRQIIRQLVIEVSGRTLSFDTCSTIIKMRRNGYWFHEFSDIYAAIEFAAKFLYLFHETDLSIDSATSALHKYSENWFIFDQLYRKFIYHSLESGQTSLLSKLTELIENVYNNNFLLPLNNNWQKIIDNLKNWPISGITAQSDFFRDRVQPYLEKKKKVAVIISDALRYEIGDELIRFINREDRYSATLTPMLAMLPSFTQLGMAALLPHYKLQFSEAGSGEILVDDKSSRGLNNRGKLLDKHCKNGGQALRSDDLLALNRDECREIVRENEVIYIYHNRIDAVGDKLESEGRVFAAVEETLPGLVKIIKKLTAANISNILLTTDHGFIYQNRTLDESEFAGKMPEAETIKLRDRRFVLGGNFYTNDSCKVFTENQLGLSGNDEIALPKSINRLRLKGSGSRFVHGGASLQEVILPVININKKRTSDVSQVEIDILQGPNTIITSGQIAVVFYQCQAVTDKIQPRTLRAAIYSRQGEMISDQHELVFNSSSDNVRDREEKQRFILSKKADKLNNQEVVMRLDENIPETSHFREYKSCTYKIRRSFETDFDF